MHGRRGCLVTISPALQPGVPRGPTQQTGSMSSLRLPQKRWGHVWITFWSAEKQLKLLLVQYVHYNQATLLSQIGDTHPMSAETQAFLASMVGDMRDELETNTGVMALLEHAPVSRPTFNLVWTILLEFVCRGKFYPRELRYMLTILKF